ncbi:MAG: PIN domain-containing protein [Armatimonadia bacterium]
MTASPEELVVLDANILVHLLRMDSTGTAIEAEHRLTARRERPILSSVVEAEILSFTRYNRWGQEQIDLLLDLLGTLLRVDAGHPDVVAAYIDLYCEARRRGRYRQFRQNDLWIAATARAAQAVVYTMNGKDFDWIDPAYLKIVHVRQA